jgi:hypothetical protein
MIVEDKAEPEKPVDREKVGIIVTLFFLFENGSAIVPSQLMECGAYTTCVHQYLQHISFTVRYF